MTQDDIVYVTGHMHPDTDSVAAAIAYAFFKRTQGVRAVPCRLGELNAETKYLLDRFGFDEPMLLQDARKTLAEIDLDAPISISPDTTIRRTLQVMQDEDQPYLGVTDEEKYLIGMVTKSDLVNVGLGDTALGIELLKQTPVKNIAETIEGTLYYDDPEVHMNGKVSIIALTAAKLEKYDIRDRVVIMGDDPESQLELIKKGAGVLIVVWSNDIREDVLEAAKKNHCPIILSGHGSMNTSRYIYFAPPVKLIMNRQPVTFREDELAEDVSKKITAYRFRAFPVIDDEQHLKAYVGRHHLMNYKNKKIILVDHNEFSQSVRAIEKAQLLEVIDHHRINDFATNQPVNFRNEIIGSTATIVQKIYRENQIPIPPNMAGLLLGAVLSDTLMFQSPTTTQVDIDAANVLAALGDLDIKTFGKDMFSASSDIKGKKFYDLINQDIKFFEIRDVKTMVSQIIVPELSVFAEREEEILRAMETFVGKKNLDLLVVATTGILDNGSIFYAAGEKAKWMEEAFPNQRGERRSLQKGIVSRKKQIVPAITEVINKYA
ncbi:MAG: putative manganese-dependent inorganic diphosphatase [Erysipelotrichaceae bacterium]|nr:putative manganese-dependent inorganic diphosphatase [Erysipelotrichaceae bacterium]